MIRVKLPAHLRTLAGARGELTLEIKGDITLSSVLDALEADHPVLQGTIRDRITGERRSLVRFFACGEDLSHEPPETLLPAEIVSGKEPLLIIGAMAGGL